MSAPDNLQGILALSDKLRGKSGAGIALSGSALITLSVTPSSSAKAFTLRLVFSRKRGATKATWTMARRG